MTNIIVDGFATYGLGGGDTIHAAMLAGPWAEVLGFPNGSGTAHLPWDLTDTSYWLTGDANGAFDNVYCARRVLPATLTNIIVSCHFAMAAMPSVTNRNAVLTFRDGSNNIIAELWVETTGALKLDTGTGTHSTSGPVLVAETDTHLEMQLNTSGGTFTLYVNGTKVLDLTSLTFTNSGPVAQLGFCHVSGAGGSATPYLSHLVIRNTSGSVNNAITGDRRVATLLPNRDDPTAQGWTAWPLQRFGTGILDLSAANTACHGPVSTASDIGNQDFCIEGQFRFQALPTTSNKAVLFSKWDEGINARSYDFYLGGPSLENGALVFRTSTNGASGTVAEKIKWPWVPIVGHWYDLALSRSAGELLLFINGVQQGLPIADSDTYFAGGARPAIGAEMTSGSPVTGTIFDGWQDEFRLTIGAGRYTGSFAPPTGAFPRNGGDPLWADVRWLSSWDNGSIADDGPLALALAGGIALTPNDGDGNYEVLHKPAPDDDTYLEAALLAAAGILTMTAVPIANETVTVGTKDGTNAAVYTFKASVTTTAFQVKIGADVPTTAANLANAIIGGPGSGTVYGSSTTINNDVSAATLPSGQMTVTALTPGTVGNAIASTETLTNGAWGGSTLAGGQDIPGYSQFGFEHMPPGTTIVDSVTFAVREWKSDAGAANTQMSFVGGAGGVLNGTSRAISTVPTVYFDTFEEDPDTTSTLTPTSILNGKIRMDRTA